ncbi:MAG: hypothetical protein Q8L86_13165, partial [Vicinamibacterales bacterium]|nr:hypothetical protein [Vicinamibacterales bacterium]
GLAASMAILIRPNLAPLAAVLGLWLLWHGDGERRWRTAAVFALAVVPGSLAVAWFQHTLYGSPFASGYGNLGALFSTTHVATNLRQFGQWMIDTQTPLAAAGLAALVAPIGWLWPDRAAWRAAVLLALVTATVWLLYLPYTPFDAWWFLRFLLPAWPALAVGMAALLLRGLGRAGRWGSGAAALAILATGFVTAGRAPALGVYLPGEGERRYVSIAEHVARLTPPNAVIISGQHSGSIRYYAGRDTLRFEVLDEAWLDRAVAWLDAEGRPAYFLLEDWELARFEARFSGQHTHGRLAAPVLAFRAHRVPGLAYLFDPRHRSGPTEQPAPVADPRPRCAPPAGSPRLAAWAP